MAKRGPANVAGQRAPKRTANHYTQYLSSVIAGLSTPAANGSTKDELKRTAQMAIRHMGY